jgi:hypothetical protein
MPLLIQKWKLNHNIIYYIPDSYVGRLRLNAKKMYCTTEQVQYKTSQYSTGTVFIFHADCPVHTSFSIQYRTVPVEYVVVSGTGTVV